MLLPVTSSRHGCFVITFAVRWVAYVAGGFTYVLKHWVRAGKISSSLGYQIHVGGT